MTIERCIGLTPFLELLRHYSALDARTEPGQIGCNLSKEGRGRICDGSNAEDMQTGSAIGPVIH